MEKLFEKASRDKVRFQVKVGVISTEDLWELSLESLNTIAKSLNKQVKEAAEEDFITTRSKSNAELDLKFEIVKYIIGVKLAEKAEKAARLEKAEKKAKIQGLIDKKQDEVLSAKSVEELQKELAEL